MNGGPVPRRSRPRPYLLGAAVVAILASATACQVNLGNPDRLPGTLIIEWQGLTIDTVDAVLDAAIFAQVLDTRGVPMSGRFIRFTALPLGPEGRPGVFLAPAGFTPTEPTVQVLTDPGGIAVAQLRLGTVVGEAGIWITVFDLVESDTVFVTVLPGQAAAIDLQPADTTLQLGSSFQVRSVLSDFYGNATQGVPTYSAEGSVSIQGATVTGVTLGQGLVTGSIGAARDTVVVNVTGSGG